MRSGLIVDLHMLVRLEDRIILMRRANTGFQDGSYGLPSGHLESNERPVDGAIRELSEELGIECDRDDLKLCHLMHNRSNTDRMALFFAVERWSGTPRNNEPHKCDHMAWFGLSALPESTIPYIHAALDNISSGVFYAEHGGEHADPRETRQHQLG